MKNKLKGEFKHTVFSCIASTTNQHTLLFFIELDNQETLFSVSTVNKVVSCEILETSKLESGLIGSKFHWLADLTMNVRTCQATALK